MKYVHVPVVAKTVYLAWHGTRDKHLRHILKGLCFKPKKDLWLDSTIFVPINQGVYFTLNPVEAINYAHANARNNAANPILILADLSMDQENISLDEDEILDNCPDKLTVSNFVQFLRKLLCSKYGVDSSRFDSWLRHSLFAIKQFVSVAYTREERRQLSPEKKQYTAEDFALRTVLKEIGKLSTATRNLTHFAVTTPIKYKGSKKIVAIFRLGETVCVKQIYGDTKYTDYFLKQLRRYSVSEQMTP